MITASGRTAASRASAWLVLSRTHLVAVVLQRPLQGVADGLIIVDHGCACTQRTDSQTLLPGSAMQGGFAVRAFREKQSVGRSVLVIFITAIVGNAGSVASRAKLLLLTDRPAGSGFG